MTITAFMYLFLGVHFGTWNRRQDTWILSIVLVCNFVKVMIWVTMQHFPQAYFITFFELTFFFPLYYFYALSLTKSLRDVFSAKNLLWYVPWVADTLYKSYWLLQSDTIRTQHLFSQAHATYRESFEMITYVYAIVLTLVIFKDLNRYTQQAIIDTHHWLKQTNWVLLFTYIFWLIDDLQVELGLPNLPAVYVHLISTLIFLLLLCWLGFTALRTSSFSDKVTLTESSPKQPQETQYEEAYKKLRDFLISTKLYTKTDLTLDDLTSELGVKKTVLSQAIHQATNANYYYFINNFRHEEFKQLFASEDGKKFTIETLIQQSGFGSKATFYNFFKKKEGMTPKQYAKMQQKKFTVVDTRHTSK